MRISVGGLIFLGVVFPSMGFASWTSPPYETVQIACTKVRPNVAMVLAAVGGDKSDVSLVNKNKTKAVKATTVCTSKVGGKEFFEVTVGLPDLCGASGNCPLALLVKSSNGYKKVFSDGGSSIWYLSSKNNGLNDIIIPHHMSAFETVITGYSYDGTRYREFGTIWEISDGQGGNIRYLTSQEYENLDPNSFRIGSPR